MGYVILDLEFNNMMDIEKYFNRFDSNNIKVCKECPNEIIEIGAVKLDKYLKELDSLRIYVKPCIYDVYNPKIKEITGISEKELAHGITFKEALNILKDFVGDNTLCSWAKDDITEIVRNAKYHRCDNIDWIKGYIDIQEYCTKVMGEKKSMSLKRAIEKLNIRMDEGNLHDALNDAEYTKEVFRRIYNYRALKNYIVEDILDMPAIVVKEDDNIDIDTNSIEIKCPKCNSDVVVEYPLKFFNWRFIALSHCDKCKNKILHEVIIKKTLKGKMVYKVNKTIINEIEYMNYADKIKQIG